MGVDAIMLVRVPREMTDAEIDHLSWRCLEALGSSRFYGRALSRCEGRLDQEAEPGTTLLEAGIWTRHYGIGYERGDYVLIAALAEWLEANTGGVVYYGTDHGDDSRPWSAIAAGLKRHWLVNGGVPYAFSEPREARYRKICPDCHEVMSQNGFGPEYAFVHCIGCDTEMRTSDGGRTWQIEKDRRHPAVDAKDREAGTVIADWAMENGLDATSVYAAFLVLSEISKKRL